MNKWERPIASPFSNMQLTPRLRFVLSVSLGCMLAGCSIRQLAINSLSDVLAEGNSVFESDNDPAFIAEALPFSLKLIDALLEQNPNNQGLLLAAASGYTFYGYAYLATVADEVSRDDIGAARELRLRARNLFLRAHDYSARALEAGYPGIRSMLLTDPETAVLAVTDSSDRDVEMLYWNAASLSLAISSSRNESALLARAAEVDAQLSRALELDESWNEGALHDLAISAAALTDADDDSLAAHYERALFLSVGKRAGLHIAYAEATAIPRQDRQAFVDLLDRALAVDANLYPDLRLINTVSQQRATWLLENIDQLFLE